MPIGIALVLIFILYLIDKHNRWRQALKLTVGLIVLGIMGIGGFFGWQKYEAWQETRQEARQEAAYEAEQAKQAAQKQAELAKACREWEDKHPIGSPPDKVGTGKQFFVLDAPQGCEGPLETDYDTRNIWVLVPANSSKPKLKSGSQTGQYSAADVQDVSNVDYDALAKKAGGLSSKQFNCEAVVCSDWALVTSEYGSAIENRNCFDTSLSSRVSCGKIAVLKKGDRVQILADKVRAPDGSDIHEVKFQQWTGWVSASDLSPEKRGEK